MRLWRAVGLVCSGGSLLVSLGACGSSKDGSNVGSGAASGTVAGSAGTSSTGPDLGGPDLGLAGDSSGSGASGGSSSGSNDCAGQLIEAKRLPLDMYVMLDVSGSMLEETEGDASVTKWDAVSSALSDFVRDPASAGMSMGLQVFPLRHPDAPKSCTTNAQCAPDFGRCFMKTCWNAFTSLTPCDSDAECDNLSGDCVAFGRCEKDNTFVCPSPGTGDCGTDPDTGNDLGACLAQPAECTLVGDCRAVDYATPAVPIAELPAGQATLLGAISAAKPDPNGLTPTGPALAGAISQSKSWAQTHPDHQVVAVLATDGMPTLESSNQVCQPVLTQTQIDAVSALAASGKSGTPSISTFVIGVLGPSDTGASATLQSIAAAGGSNKAFLVDTSGDVQAQFRKALDQIRSAGLSCELAVPEADAGTSVDYKQVNVDFTDKSGKVEHLLNVPSQDDCKSAPDQHGWYWDVDVSKGEVPTRILTCPATCSEFQSTDMGSVQISLGCKTRMVVK